MTPLFKKLNYKNQPTIFILNAPDSFQSEIDAMREVAVVKTDVAKAKDIPFVLAFVTKLKEVESFASKLKQMYKDDEVIWLVYPKLSSKKYTCEFNRDTGWQALGDIGFEDVRMVAIDEDWSALRFRKAENIKSITRSFAMSKKGRKKSTLKRRK
ncbi:MAG: hypothetical protein O9302_09520 [Cyclobacteriaceae bacterium]|jgi:hypothetical protein|nr:hypothetical protein [Cytophagales bacterium]MCZ8328284.1 hypothetical protein [Cyclobacteriaceae bacterium]